MNIKSPQGDRKDTETLRRENLLRIAAAAAAAGSPQAAVQGVAAAAGVPVQAIMPSAAVPALQSHTHSRYRTDFEELEFIAAGGFGSVVKARNKVDQRIYAVKKIVLKGSSREEEDFEKKLMREVNLLSRLHHQHVVRYYAAWKEESTGEDELLGVGAGGDDDEDDDDEEASRSPSPSPSTPTSASDSRQDMSSPRSRSWISEQSERRSKQKNRRIKVIYIQMELCTRDIRRAIDDRVLSGDRNEVMRQFRQIVEALVYLHENSIIHRDLKPANVLYSVENEIKVGDFGLAKSVSDQSGTGPQDRIRRNTSIVSLQQLNEGSASEDMSTGIGTQLYTAPEVLTGTKYTAKVDMYSLGIILLEMLLPPFSTGMERFRVLTEARRTGKVPPQFPKSFDKERQIIEWLLQQDADKRPTARELLERTDLVPVAREEEHLALLFAQKISDYEIRLGGDKKKGATSSQSASSLMGEYSYGDLLAQAKLSSVLEMLFQLHGAIRFDMPSTFLPNSQQVAEMAMKPQNPLGGGEKLSAMMFRSGQVVQMSSDIVLPFARYLSRLSTSTCSFIKRYSFDKVFKENTMHGGSPYAERFAAFDIVGTTYKLVAEAEVLLAAAQVASCLTPNKGKFVIRINHSSIIRAILDHSGVEESKHQAVVKYLSKLHKSDWSYIRAQLVERLKLSDSAVNKLWALLSIHGDPVHVRDTLSSKLSARSGGKAREALTDLATLIGYFDSSGVWPMPNHLIVFDVSLCSDYQRYSGLMFQVGIQTKKRFTALGGGGRYDKLVQKFSIIDLADIQHVVGFCLKMERILTLTRVNEQAPLLAALRRAAIMRHSASLNRSGSLAVAPAVAPLGGYAIPQHTAASSMSSGVGSSADRFAAMQQAALDEHLPPLSGLQDLVAVCSAGKGKLERRMKLIVHLWNNGIPADFQYDDRMTPIDAETYCLQHEIRWMVIVEDDALTDRVKVKYVNPRATLHASRSSYSHPKKPIDVSTADLVQILLGAPPDDSPQASHGATSGPLSARGAGAAAPLSSTTVSPTSADQALKPVLPLLLSTSSGGGAVITGAASHGHHGHGGHHFSAPSDGPKLCSISKRPGKQRSRSEDLAIKLFTELYNNTFNRTCIIVADLQQGDVEHLLSTWRRGQLLDLKHFKLAPKKASTARELEELYQEVKRKGFKSLVIFSTEDDRITWSTTEQTQTAGATSAHAGGPGGLGSGGGKSAH